MNRIDFGKTANDYRQHRAGFPAEAFARLRDWGIGQPGQRLLDLGTGTGTLARGFALQGAQVSGIDPAAAMLQQARELDAAASAVVDYVVGCAEVLPWPEGEFDVVSAGQCWHWFDGLAAAREAFRVLKPGGQMLIAHFDWLPLPGNVVAATEALILQHNPHWRGANGCGIHPAGFAQLAQAGFTELESCSFDLAVPYTHVGWRGRIRASAGVAASLPPEQVATFDAELATLLASDFPQEPLAIPHRVFLLRARKP